MTTDADPAVVARLRAAGCVFAEDEARLLAAAAGSPAELDLLVERRADGLPLELVGGWAEFHGLRIFVDPGVFVPRRRSEFLVDTAVSLARGPDPVIVDLCCGTGALGLAVAVALRGRVGILICNAPYVPSQEVAFLPPEARDYEPRGALDGGPDGLTVLRRVAAEAPGWLAAGGTLLVETSGQQAPAMTRAVTAGGLTARVSGCAEYGATVVTGSAELFVTVPAFSRSTMTVKVSVACRRARLLARHQLSVPAATVAGAVDAMVALHGTDPVTVYLSARARVPAATVEAVDEALYGSRAIVRMLGMRRTVFVVPAPLFPVVQRACTDDVARRLRRQLERDLANGGVGDGDAAGWLRNLGDGALRALAARGSATGAQLSADEPRLRTQMVYVPDKSYGGAANITSRVLVMLAAEGHMIRGHRRGGWSSGQFEWFPTAAWLTAAPGPAADGADGPADAGRDAATARAELARRWLLTFGPAPVSDPQWWAGWTGAQTKA